MNHHFHPDVPHHLRWAQHHRGHPTSSEAMAATAAANGVVFKTAEKEYMFEKQLTPSDVGKLNRLVIPKQHAEKYFPLAGGSSSISGLDSGLLLSFEDESGKSWEFRYSYWSSSQSYVLTKGWSRYVKEKGLDAGDYVVFGQLSTDVRHMFISYRHKIAAAAGNVNGDVRAWSQGACYPSHDSYPASSTVVQSRTTPSDGKSKILRLFGVNLEYQLKPSQNDASETSSLGSPSVQSQSQARYKHYCPTIGDISCPQNYMEYNLSEDTNQMRYHHG